MSLIDLLIKDIKAALESGEAGESARFVGSYGEIDVNVVLTQKSESVLEGISAVEASSQFLEVLSADVAQVRVNDKVTVRGKEFYIVDKTPTIYGTTTLYVSEDRLK
ncbi:MAG: hypothetical protein LBP40_04695 [Campylobacteraceae bacterium]|jgi:hypothetical protein|nr:hypothetical protein [Campylobacteraceae bacterium]